MPRGRPGESRYIRKRRSIITFKEFEDLLKKLDLLLHKSLLTLLYYTGLRPAEVVGDRPRRWKVLTKKGKSLSLARELPKNWMQSDEGDLWEYRYRNPLSGIRKEDITIEGDVIQIYSKPLKHGKREGSGQLELDINFPYVDLIVEQWKKTEPREKIWNVTTWDLWNRVSTISEGKIYPHAFRLSRATRMARNPEMSISDMKQWFGWSRASTADSYIVPVRSVSKVRESIREEIPEVE